MFVGTSVSFARFDLLLAVNVKIQSSGIDAA
jgi:hypothetical protein